MHKVRVLFLVIVFSLYLLGLPWSQTHAQEVLAGGRGGNLVVREGSVIIQKENLDIKLHLGFAEVSQDFQIQNGSSAQKVVFGFPYRLGQSEHSLNNFLVTANGTPVEISSTKESDSQEFIYWKIFELNFAPNQVGNVKISHWQLNGASIRGMRSFNYSLKNKLQTEIGEFNLKLSLMDGVYLDNFDRTANQDLDLKLEPLGWKQEGSDLTWTWDNIVPSLDIVGNFYWPGGDLAKTANLNQSLGLYQIEASSNNEQANLLTDSSYLSSWHETANGPGTGETLNLVFPQKNMTEFRIIPGLATSSEDFKNSSRPKEIKLEYDAGQTELVTLKDEMSVQNFALTKPVTTSSLKITINSVYAGTLLPDDTYITEIELGSVATGQNADINQVANNHPAWQKFFTNLWSKITSWFKKIF